MSLAKLQALLNVCKGGERIALAGFTIEKGSFTVPQTLSGPITLLGGTWLGFSVKGLHDVTFEKPTMLCDAADRVCYSINNSQRVFFDDPDIRGDTTLPIGTLENLAVQFDGCSHVGIDGGSVQFVRYGVSFYRDCQNFHALSTEYKNIRTDAIRGEGGNGAEIAHNNIHDMSPPSVGGAAGDHPDGIQFWTGIQRPKQPPRNFKIHNNQIWRGNGTHFQGIFFRDYWAKDTADGLPVDKRRDEPQNIEIYDNDCIGLSPNGIALAGTGRVENNVVMGVGTARERSKLIVHGRAQGVAVPVVTKGNYGAQIIVDGPLDPSNTILPYAMTLQAAMACMLLNDGVLPPSVPPEQTPEEPPAIPEPPLPAPEPDPGAQPPHPDPQPEPTPEPQPEPETPPTPAPIEAVLVPRDHLLQLQGWLNELLS